VGRPSRLKASISFAVNLPFGSESRIARALAMAPPLSGDGQVTYGDGTKSTVDQMAKDVAAFLVWTAEPKLDKRKQTGWPVVLFLLAATVLAYLSYQNVWRDKKH